MDVAVIDIITAGLFTSLAALAGWAWWQRRDPSTAWLTLTFSILALVTVAGLLLPEDPNDAQAVFVQFELALLGVFPFALHRFAASFRPAPRAIEWLARASTAIVVAFAITLRDLPEEDEPLSTAVSVFLVVLAVQWVVLLTSVAIALWRGGTGQPVVVRRRMRLLATGAVGITVALLTAAANAGSEDAVVTTAIGIVTIASALAFFCGFLPPRPLRMTWQAANQAELRNATIALMGTDEEHDLAGTFLPHVGAMLGAAGAEMFDREGGSLGAWGEPVVAAPGSRGVQVLEVDVPFGRMAFLASPYTPFFGTDELALVRSMGVVIELALERHEALAQQRAIAARLESMNQLKNEFVAVVAHDLRSPMSVISGFARTLDDQWDRLPEDKKREILRMIADNTESLADLVEDVLQVARIESGEFGYDMESFDLRELADRIARDMRSLERNDVVVDVSPDVPTAYGDPGRIWQVMTNLVSNAMKFSPVHEAVRIEISCDAGRVRTAVVDRGIGIAEPDQARVFDKFSRIDPADRSQRVKGNGLGLFICRTIVEAHDGELTLDSDVGRGSTFTFTLPTTEEPSP